MIDKITELYLGSQKDRMNIEILGIEEKSFTHEEILDIFKVFLQAIDTLSPYTE